LRGNLYWGTEGNRQRWEQEGLAYLLKADENPAPFGTFLSGNRLKDQAVISGDLGCIRDLQIAHLGRAGR
jgi:hypothetical protein